MVSQTGLKQPVDIFIYTFFFFLIFVFDLKCHEKICILQGGPCHLFGLGPSGYVPIALLQRMQQM